jgi:Lipid A 3-O-deacylase (PagL)
LEELSNPVTLILVTERPHLRYNQRPRLLNLLLTLWLSTVICTPSLAGDIALLSIGPRVGFSGGTPLLGKRPTESFRMADVAAVFTLPWSWPLGGSAWSLETRLTASAGLLEAAGDSSLIMTVVPGLELSGWKGLVSFDAGAGAGFFSDYKFGEQDFGGPVQLTVTAGVRVNPFSHVYAGFRGQHFSDAGLYGSSSLGIDLYIVELGYRF